MSVKLLLNPAAASKACPHPTTGVIFHIKPISPERYDEIRNSAMKKDKAVDYYKFQEEIAVAAIEDWEGIGDKSGPLPCDESNKRIFGRTQAVNIMPWIIDQATSLDHFRIEEETAAKNA